LRRLFDNSSPILNPADIVLAFTKKRAKDLYLPPRAIITFASRDLRIILKDRPARPIPAWSAFRRLYHVGDSDTIVTQSPIGGPNVAAIVEELSTFGVREFILWGYCGSLTDEIAIGDVLIAKGAVREDGVSYHYLKADGDIVLSDWFPTWYLTAREAGMIEAVVWSCDAIYRETINKIAAYRERGIAAVEMEVASFYSVGLHKHLKCIAFLVVSDRFREGIWTGGFFTKPVRNGVERVSDFILQRTAGPVG